MDSVTLDIEDMMDTAICLREMEKKVEEWEAEEAELKLAEFEVRCSKKASQYEDRIARLEAEIARRAGNLQLLPQFQSSPQEVEEKEDVEAEVIVEEKTKQKPVAKPQGRFLEEAKQVVEDIRADRLVNSGWDKGISEEVKTGLLAMRRSLCAAAERQEDRV